MDEQQNLLLCFLSQGRGYRALLFVAASTKQEKQVLPTL